MRDRFTLGRRLGKALLAVGADAVASPLGVHLGADLETGWGALPLSPHAIANPEVLERLLRVGSVPDGISELPLRPTAVLLTSLKAPSSNCQNTLIGVDWLADGNAAQGPRTLFVKQSCQDFGTRLFANAVGFWETECAFCRNLAALAPIDVPRIHAVAQRRSRFVILMENLSERPDTRLFTNRNMLGGVGIERARRCLRTLARLHVGFSGWTPESRDRALPVALDPQRSPVLAPAMLAINRLSVGPCHRRLSHTFDAATAALYERALDHWDLLRDVWQRGPVTLVHGDSHLGNFFETKREAGPEMGMIDFQGAHWGNGIRDVQYFLINSMRPDVLANNEKQLVSEYAAEVTRLGMPLSPDDALDQYRGFSFHTLMTAVVSNGLGSFNNSDAVLRMVLERAVAATRRLDFASWMEARIEAA